ncbi:MAG: ribonucleotide-diphosphate reductase subunit alpha [Candidatus Altiarchaeales archaeon]|nr:MAG: ribonucleotide-diphosphate reductase subunit alpha [Candidatus Altiarchaeales archaeon]
MIKKVRKRDGRIVKFDKNRIFNAILGAMREVSYGDEDVARKISERVIEKLEYEFRDKIPDVENIQDTVENILMEEGLNEVARAYIIYRHKHAEIRESKQIIGVKDDLKLNINAIKVLESRYLMKDINGKVIETPSQMFRRVARVIAKADFLYDKTIDVKGIEERFYNAMSNLEFLPNSPTLMNAGTEIGQLSACFVIPIDDSMRSIFSAVKYMALIHQSGGGTGFSFSRLRPKNDIVKSTKGVASGPVSFMRVFDTATEVIKQGGKRRGANMGILHVTHPDIEEFIRCKEKVGEFSNFNISVAVTDKFMEAVIDDTDIELINPRTKKAVNRVSARRIFDLIVANAWKTGDPGVIFIDEINRHNPTPMIGEIECTNPCGEQPLLPYESCNLGSINLSRIVDDNRKIDWDRLREIVRLGVHFLDNVIDVNKFPLKKIENRTKGNRKIGLGVMGFADMLIQLGIPYNSKSALKLAERIMKFISRTAIEKSIELGELRGSFPNFNGSIWDKRGYSSMRNATLTTIAPTGTISIIASCSSGIEPIFAVSYIRNVMEGTRLLEVNPFFERMAMRRNFYSRELMMKIARKGSIQELGEIPSDIRDIFVTALDMEPEWHVRMQAAFQRYTDNAVSKTVNLPFNATPDDIKKIFMLAYKLKCKGVTVYRYGSKENQVLYLGSIGEGKDEDFIRAESEYSGGCPTDIYCSV